ncbi:MAG: hypothetical protein JWO83_4048 [Caulobacteraceae bacterium]|nr:hypothetical protein [Caulobacteraceae bacterium]
MLTPGLGAAKRERAAGRREAKARRVAALEDLLFHLALNAERDETRIAAAARLHAIYCGHPAIRQAPGNETSAALEPLRLILPAVPHRS